MSEVKIKSVCRIITVLDAKSETQFICLGTPDEIDNVVAGVVAPAHKKKWRVKFEDGSTQQVVDLPINGHNDLVWNDAGLVKYKRVLKTIDADGKLTFDHIKNVWRKY